MYILQILSTTDQCSWTSFKKFGIIFSDLLCFFCNLPILAAFLNSECQNVIFRMAKQMVKERHDITGLNCIKGASGKVIVDDKGIKDSWKEYVEKLMNEENEWDHKISAEFRKDQQIASGWPK